MAKWVEGLLPNFYRLPEGVTKDLVQTGRLARSLPSWGIRPSKPINQ